MHFIFVLLLALLAPVFALPPPTGSPGLLHVEKEHVDFNPNPKFILQKHEVQRSFFPRDPYDVQNPAHVVAKPADEGCKHDFGITFE